LRVPLIMVPDKYFTKWIKARAVSTITSKIAQKFFWQNIVCRFGVPSELTVDNGKQFDSQDFKDFRFSIGTKLAFASVYHLQSNGVVERANGKFFTAVKKMLLDEKMASGPICYLRRSGR
jgi:transposase InsO family protein